MKFKSRDYSYNYTIHLRQGMTKFYIARLSKTLLLHYCSDQKNKWFAVSNNENKDEMISASKTEF